MRFRNSAGGRAEKIFRCLTEEAFAKRKCLITVLTETVRRKKEAASVEDSLVTNTDGSRDGSVDYYCLLSKQITLLDILRQSKIRNLRQTKKTKSL